MPGKEFRLHIDDVGPKAAAQAQEWLKAMHGGEVDIRSVDVVGALEFGLACAFLAGMLHRRGETVINFAFDGRPEERDVWMGEAFSQGRNNQTAEVFPLNSEKGGVHE